AVVGLTEPEVAERSRRLERRRALGALHHAERDAEAAKAVVHLVVEPRGVPELERDAEVRRHLVQEVLETRNVALQERGKVEKDGSEPALQRRRGLTEVAGDLGGVAKAKLMRDAARRLQREREVLGHFFRPALELAHARHAIEGVVDLDTGETLG